MEKPNYMGFQVAGLVVASTPKPAPAAPRSEVEMPTAEDWPSQDVLNRFRARMARESTSTELRVVEDVFAKFGL